MEIKNEDFREVIDNQSDVLKIDLIREKYTINQELAILRQRDSKPNAYEIYNNFVEGCKAQAKSIIESFK